MARGASRPPGSGSEELRRCANLAAHLEEIVEVGRCLETIGSHMYPWAPGVPGDEAKAAAWFRAAAEDGDADAQLHLGHMYAFGEGVLEDDGEAVRWYRRVAQAGSHAAEAALGVAYSRGVGVPQEAVRAHMWSSLTAPTVPEARELMKDLDATLSDDQVAEARRLAGEWRSSHPLPTR